jgi:ribonuclease P/MRP protein subunit POP1
VECTSHFSGSQISGDSTKAPKPRKLRDLPRLKKLKRTKMSRKEMLEARASKKHWLETHLWHAKRMKMVHKWDRTIALTPTQKSFRPAYRASKHGVSIYDASYLHWTAVDASAPHFPSALRALWQLCGTDEVPYSVLV